MEAGTGTNEAAIVKEIFEKCRGNGRGQHSKEPERQGFRTNQPKTYGENTILQILTTKNIGDAILLKTYGKDYVKKNDGSVPMYYLRIIMSLSFRKSCLKKCKQ